MSLPIRTDLVTTDTNIRRLRSHRSPPRRSPRLLLSHNNDNGIRPNPSNSKKNLCNGPSGSPKTPNPAEAMKEQIILKQHVRVGKRKRANSVISSKKKRKLMKGRGSWSKEQEVALRRAYLAAKPSPHFWKKVSKMVPGKSSQECFDRIHADLTTPPQDQPCSKANKTNTSRVGYLSLSGSEMVGFVEPKNTRLLSSKPKSSRVARKMVRHLLRKHCFLDQSQESDLFSVFETSPIALTLDVPETNNLPPATERSSSAHKKFSRFKTANRPSPEVLKQIKNIALHERYIDRLHNREARRACVVKDHENGNVLKTAGIVNAAWNALMSKTKDLLTHFQNVHRDSIDDHEAFDATGDDDGDDSGDELSL